MITSIKTHVGGLLKLLQTQQQIHPLSRKRKKSPKLKYYQMVFIHFKAKKIWVFFSFFAHTFRKMLALIILVPRLHSIITYVECCSSLKHNEYNWCIFFFYLDISPIYSGNLCHSHIGTTLVCLHRPRCRLYTCYLGDIRWCLPHNRLLSSPRYRYTQWCSYTL